MVRTRLAPSPTGFMHIGTLRTALYTWLFTRQQGGQFILRIEDTDQKRYTEGAIEALMEGLRWAGLEYDEGPDVGGPCGPYIQSERLDMYKKYAMQLVNEGKAYYCFATEEELKQMREEQIAMKKQPMYDRRYRNITPEEVEKRLANNESYVIRMKMPLDGEVAFSDMIRGNMKVACNTLDDFVLLKSDGYPTYHLAMAVDDHFMKITHVTRTEEWLPSLPKHILLYQAFGWEAPQFAHMPLLLNKDKTKLSKRKGDVSLTSYINKGYLKEALINFLALLGWNTPDDREIFSMEDLLREFSMDRVHKAGAIVDPEKLDWLNSTYIRALEPTELAHRVLDFHVERGLLEKKDSGIYHPGLDNTVSWEYFEAIVRELQTRLVRLDEFLGLTTFFFAQDISYGIGLLEHEKMKATLEVVKDIVPRLHDKLLEISEADWNREKLKEVLLPFIAEQGFKNGQALWPMRALLTGSEQSPGAFEVADILGRATTLQRFEKAIALLAA